MRDSEPMNSGEFDAVASFAALSNSTMKCIKGVSWKDTPAHYFLNNIEENLVLEKQLQSGKYKQKKPKKFTVYYPKERDIVSVHFRDRVFQRSLNDNVLYPKISRGFIYDNMACQKGKGPDLARERLKCFLQRYYRKHGTAGYVLKCDIKGYYPNMSHKVVKDCFHKVIDGWTYKQAVCVLDGQYDSEIGFNPGSQMIQIAGIGILNALDHFIKEELRIEYYIRYMDDFILIHEDREVLESAKEVIRRMVEDLGLELNSKTQVFPLKQGIMFLKWHFILTGTGKVIRKLSRKNVTRETRKLKKLAEHIKAGKIPEEYLYMSFQSWRANAQRGNTHFAVRKMERLYNDLKGEITDGHHEEPGGENGEGDGTGRGCG